MSLRSPEFKYGQAVGYVTTGPNNEMQVIPAQMYDSNRVDLGRQTRTLKENESVQLAIPGLEKIVAQAVAAARR